MQVGKLDINNTDFAFKAKCVGHKRTIKQYRNIEIRDYIKSVSNSSRKNKPGFIKTQRENCKKLISSLELFAQKFPEQCKLICSKTIGAGFHYAGSGLYQSHSISECVKIQLSIPGFPTQILTDSYRDGTLLCVHNSCNGGLTDTIEEWSKNGALKPEYIFNNLLREQDESIENQKFIDSHYLARLNLQNKIKELDAIIGCLDKYPELKNWGLEIRGQAQELYNNHCSIIEQEKQDAKEKEKQISKERWETFKSRLNARITVAREFLNI